MSSSVRVGLWHNQVSPYRIPLFKAFARQPGIDLEVLFGEVRSKERLWKVDFGSGYEYEVLRGVRIPKIPFVYNPGLRRLLVTRDYDVLLCSDAFEFGTQICFLTAKRLGKPFVLWSEHADPYEVLRYHTLRDVLMFLPRLAKRAALFWNKRLADRIKREADGYVAFSEGAKQHLLRKGGQADRIVTIQSPMDNETFLQHLHELRERGAVEELRKTHGWRDRKVLLVLSYIRRAKGIHILLEAFSRLNREDTLLVIVGEGPYKKSLQKMVAERGIKNVQFHSYTHDPAMYYAASNAMVLVPVDTEACPLTLNEALLAGIPVILSENVGSRYLLADERLIVAPGDVPELEKALARVLDDESLRESFRVVGPEIIQEQCSPELAAKGMAAAVKEAMNQG